MEVDATMVIWGSVLLGSVVFLAVVAYFVIRHYYRIYDAEQTRLETLEFLKAKVKSARDYFRATYANDFDRTVWENLKTNIDFCENLVDKKEPMDVKIKYYDRLYQTCYEVGYRLKTKFDDVSYILAPFRNFRNELVEDVLDFIKKNSDVQ